MNIQLSENRRSYILKLIETQGSVNVSDLSEMFGVSEMTIRRDLTELEKDGLVRRVHGGAISARGRSYEPPLLIRSAHAFTAKQRIGKFAAAMVADGDSIALDVGSTTIEIAKNLVSRRNLTIMTPSLHIANIFASQPDTRVILPGGILRHSEGSLIGDLTFRSFRGLFLDRLFMGVGCVDANAGFTEFNWDDALVKQAMIRSAKEIVVVADSSKFNRVAFAYITPFETVHHFVTDAMPPADLKEKLETSGVKIHIVPPDEEEETD